MALFHCRNEAYCVTRVVASAFVSVLLLLLFNNSNQHFTAANSYFKNEE